MLEFYHLKGKKGKKKAASETYEYKSVWDLRRSLNQCTATVTAQMKEPAVSIARKLLRNSHFDFFFFLVVRYITTKCNIRRHHCFDVVQLQQMETNMVEQSSYVICICIYKYIPINLLTSRPCITATHLPPYWYFCFHKSDNYFTPMSWREIHILQRGVKIKIFSKLLSPRTNSSLAKGSKSALKQFQIGAQQLPDITGFLFTQILSH